MDTTNDCKRPAEAAINKNRLQQILLETSIVARDQVTLMDTTIGYKRPVETSKDQHRLFETSRYYQRLAYTARYQVRLMDTTCNCKHPVETAVDQRRLASIQQ